MTVERGNLPSSERCGRSRAITGVSTRAIAPPLRREWPLTCQGLPAPQHNRLGAASGLLSLSLDVIGLIGGSINASAAARGLLAAARVAAATGGRAEGVPPVADTLS